MLRLGLQTEGEPDDDSLTRLGQGADFTLILDEAGIIRRIFCRNPDLRREMEGAADWIGMPWSSTTSRESGASVATLLQAAPPYKDLRRRHVDQITSNGRSIPMLYSAFRADGQIIALGYDLRSMDLTEILLKYDGFVARAYAKAMRLRGIKLETLCLDILAPAARRLGDLWSDDACSFTDVTVGVGHLQGVLRDTFLPNSATEHEGVESKRILLAAAPGEGHTFGLAMVAGLFRHAGWLVQHQTMTSDTMLAQTVSRNWFAIIGLSSSDERRLDVLKACIRKLRKASRNKAVRIMVGGVVFIDQPEITAQVGADFMAFDARDAVRRAQRYLDDYSDAAGR